MNSGITEFINSMYAYIVTGFGIYVFALALSNVLYLHFSTKQPVLTSGPLVSVLIPVRNEENNIGPCLDSLLNQTYNNYEIIVLDDQSEDNTWEIISRYASIHQQITAVKGKALPTDWNGKPHAMHQLAGKASGEYLIFVDADTRHNSSSISWAVTNAESHRFDMLSGYTRHINKSIGEKLVVPNMYLNTSLFLPLWSLPLIPFSYFSHAIGQFLLFRTSSYRESGGYTLVKGHISEDVYISRKMKKLGYKVGFLDAKKYVDCRMYSGFNQAVEGIGKNIFDFFGKKTYPVIVLIPVIAAFFVAPPFVLLIWKFTGKALCSVLLAGVIFFTGGWGITLYDRKQDWYLPLLYPLQFAMLIFVSVKSAVNSLSGRGYMWKGRNLK